MQFSNECVRAEITVIILSFCINLALPASKPTQSQGRDFVEKFMRVPHTYLYALGEKILDDSIKVIILSSQSLVSMLKAFAAGGETGLCSIVLESQLKSQNCFWPFQSLVWKRG